jgi:FrmR/RcnR family transcriptional regulator, repressor of frmRAB operon
MGPPFFFEFAGSKVATLAQIIPAGVSLSISDSQFFMAHTTEEKKKLLNRVRRIRGQVEAIERTLDQEAECSEVLHNISACRGAMDALMAEVIEGHIRFHILDPKATPTDEQTQAADDLIHALRAYLK